MGINFRYYIISIASVFIALGIGIFIGFNMNGQEVYLRQQQALVNNLENRFIELKNERESLEKNIGELRLEKEKQNLFLENVFYEIILNRLAGKNIAIIETTSNYFYDDVWDTLGLAGGLLPLHIKYLDKIFKSGEKEIKEINDLFKTNINNRKDLIELVNERIVNFLKFKHVDDFLIFLIDREYLECRYNYSNSDMLHIDNIIIASGDEIRNLLIEELNRNLIGGLQEEEFNIIGIERSDVVGSYIFQFQKLNISTIDNVDSKIGKLSLIYLLNGAEGHYGEKPTAYSLAPFITKNNSKE